MNEEDYNKGYLEAIENCIIGATDLLHYSEVVEVLDKVKKRCWQEHLKSRDE